MSLNEALNEARAILEKESNYLAEAGKNMQYLGGLLACKQNELGASDGNIGVWDYTTLRLLPEGDLELYVNQERILASVRAHEKARDDIARLEKQIEEESKKL